MKPADVLLQIAELVPEGAPALLQSCKRLTKHSAAGRPCIWGRASFCCPAPQELLPGVTLWKGHSSRLEPHNMKGSPWHLWQQSLIQLPCTPGAAAGRDSPEGALLPVPAWRLKAAPVAHSQLRSCHHRVAHHAGVQLQALDVHNSGDALRASL